MKILRPSLCGMCVLVLCLFLGLSALAETSDVPGLYGCAYVDENENSILDQGEQLMTGVPVTLERLNDGEWMSVAQATTDDFGKYAFSSLEAGSYRVTCALGGQDYYAASVGASDALSDGTTYGETVVLSYDAAEINVGLRPAAKLVVTAFSDKNADGLRGEKEVGVSEVLIEVMDGEEVLFSCVTDAQGEARLSVKPGTYTLRATLPSGYAFTQKGDGPSASCIGDSKDGSASSEPLAFTQAQETAAFVGVQAAGSFGGKVFEDMNNNGIMDEDEPGVAGVTIFLTGKKTGAEYSLTTDDTGIYLFERLADDNYTITASIPDGMLYARYSTTGGDLRSIFSGSTLSRQFYVKNAEQVRDKNIGVVQNGSIRGAAFLDENYNGIYDEGEPGYAGVTVEAIKISNSESLGKTVTAEDGSFTLENLRGGDYRLRAVLPNDGAIFTVVAEGTADQVNLFEQRSTRRENTIQPLSVVSGSETFALIGVARSASISGSVFQDANYDGVLGEGEKPLSGIKVCAVDETGSVAATATTNAKGVYTLTGIMPGNYIVQVQRKSGFGFTRLRSAEKGGSHVVVLEGEYGVTDTIAVAMGETITDVNAGMLPSSTVSGVLFHDLNDNGLRDENEIGMVSAAVRLYSEDAEIDLTLSVSDDGSYFFDGVMPGEYTLTYLLPEHCEMAQVVEGGNSVASNGRETTTEPFQVVMGENNARPLAGAVTLGSFTGYVFHDTNANGALDEGETRLSGATVTLTPARDGLEAQSAVSEADGSFTILGLRPADYTLNISLPDGYIFSHSINGLTLSPTQRQTFACTWQLLTDRSEHAIGAVKPSGISGHIWLDENQNGIEDEGEAVMQGVSLELVDEAGVTATQRTVSTSEGFSFDNVRPGQYTVRFALPQQSVSANAPSSTFASEGGLMVQRGVTVLEDEALSGLSTGLVSKTSIGGSLWLDENGQRTPVSGVTVQLLIDGSDQPLQTAVTAENGSYRFNGLWPAEYTLRASLPEGMIFVRPDDPNYLSAPSVISLIDSGFGQSEPFLLEMAQHQLDRNILFIKPAKVGDIAWLDENCNGLVDETEPRIPGITVSLIQNGQAVYQTVTDAYGYYLFDDVYPGEYTLEASAYAELSPTTPVSELRIISSCLTSGDGLRASSDSFQVESGSTNVNFDLGYILLEGAELPDAITAPPTRDWTISNTPQE